MVAHPRRPLQVHPSASSIRRNCSISKRIRANCDNLAERSGARGARRRVRGRRCERAGTWRRSTPRCAKARRGAGRLRGAAQRRLYPWEFQPLQKASRALHAQPHGSERAGGKQALSARRIAWRPTTSSSARARPARRSPTGSARTAAQLIVIEFGGTDWGPFIQMPAALSYPDEHDALRLGLRDRARAASRRAARWPRPRGKVLGGSSSINGMVYVRGHARDFDHWAEKGADGWGFRRCAALLQAHGALRTAASDGWRGDRRPAACHPRPAAQPALPRLRRGRRARPASRPPRTTTAPSRKASARWSRRSGTAAAGRPPTPICGRR